ncbi:MAG TPA: protein kinase, partial [Kofleriaceae bacterium]
LDGRTYERIRRRAKHIGSNAFTLQMQLLVICDVLNALTYAHKLTDFDGKPLQVVHRDVTPNNVFITFDGQVKVLDFGIAKANNHKHETQAGAIKGKLSYMAPEQARGQKVDARADVYSVGVMLWEAVAGKRMRSGTEQEMVKLASGEEAPRLTSIVPSVEPELERIVAKATRNNAAERYASAKEFQADLEGYLINFGASTSARDLGNVVDKLFTDERAKVNDLIDTYVTRARAGSAPPKDLPVIELSGREPSTTPIPTATAASVTNTLAPSAVGEVADASSIGSMQAIKLPSAPPSAKGKYIALAGVAALGIAAAAYVLGTKKTTPAPVATTEPAPTKRAPEPPPVQETKPAVATQVPTTPVAPTPGDQLIEIDVHANPANATITIDDAQVSGNPFHGKYRGDGVMHRVRVSAPGYKPTVRDVAFNANVTLELDLEQIGRVNKNGRVARVSTPAVHETPGTATPIAPPTPPVPEVKPPPPPTPTPSTGEINPNGGVKPHRTIDSKNPYAK